MALASVQSLLHLTSQQQQQSQSPEQTPEMQLKSSNFNAAAFVRKMYDGSLEDVSKSSSGMKKKRGGKGTSHSNSSLDSETFANTLNTTAASIDIVESVKKKTTADLKKKISNNYQVFITAAQDARELTELVHRQNQQTERYQRTLDLLQRGESHLMMPSHSSSGYYANSGSGTTTTTTSSSTATTTTVNKQEEALYLEEYQQDIEINDEAERYVALDVLIDQHRIEDATASAIDMIRKHQDLDEEIPSCLNYRLDQLNHVILMSLDQVPLEDEARQLCLVEMTSQILRPDSGCVRLLMLRSQIFHQQCQNIVVESANINGDFIGVDYIRKIFRAIAGVIVRTARDVRHAFSVPVPTNSVEEGTTTTTTTTTMEQQLSSVDPRLFCSFVAWIKRDCIDFGISTLARGSFNSLVGEHQIWGPEIYLYPLLEGVLSQDDAQDDAQDDDQDDDQDDAQDDAQKDEPPPARSSQSIQRDLTGGCNLPVKFSTERLFILVELVRHGVLECMNVSKSVGVPISTLVRRKLLFGFVLPAAKEHCDAFHNFVRVSTGCGIKNADSDSDSNVDSTEFLTEQSSADLSLVLMATSQTIQTSVTRFLSAMKMLPTKKNMTGGSESRTRRKHGGKDEGEDGGETNGEGDRVDLDVACRFVHSRMSKTCCWFCLMVLKSGLKGEKASELQKVMESTLCENILPVLQISLNQMSIHTPHVSPVRDALGDFQLELGNAIHLLKQQAFIQVKEERGEVKGERNATSKEDDENDEEDGTSERSSGSSSKSGEWL